MVIIHIISVLVVVEETSAAIQKQTALKRIIITFVIIQQLLISINFVAHIEALHPSKCVSSEDTAIALVESRDWALP